MTFKTTQKVSPWFGPADPLPAGNKAVSCKAPIDHIFNSEMIHDWNMALPIPCGGTYADNELYPPIAKFDGRCAYIEKSVADLSLYRICDVRVDFINQLGSTYKPDNKGFNCEPINNLFTHPFLRFYMYPIET